MTTLKVIKQHFFCFLLIWTLLPYTSTKKLLEPGPLWANQFTEAEDAALDFTNWGQIIVKSQRTHVIAKLLQ